MRPRTRQGELRRQDVRRPPAARYLAGMRLSVIYQRDGSLRPVLSSRHRMAIATTRIEHLINTYPQMNRATLPPFASYAPADCQQDDGMRRRSKMKLRPHVALAMTLFALKMAKSAPSFADRIVDNRRWHNAQQYDHVSRYDLQDSRSVHARADDWRDLPTGEKNTSSMAYWDATVSHGLTKPCHP